MFSTEGFFTKDSFHAEFLMDKVTLYSGEYFCNIFLREGLSGDIIDWVQDAFILRVEAGDFYGTGNNNVSQNDKIFINRTTKII
jgi:hypothetical protein